MGSLKKVSLNQQIEEVRLAIEDVKLYEPRKSVGDFRAERMRAALKTLEWVRDNEAAIRNFVEMRQASVTANPDLGKPHGQVNHC